MDDTFRKNSTFVELYSSNYNRIRSFILMMVPNTSEADDILQETSRIMWEKFQQYEPGTNFVSWGVTIAKYQVLKYRKNYNSKVPLSSEIIDKLSEDFESPLDRENDQLDALRGCLKKLEKKDYHLIQSRFEHKKTARELSQQIGVAMNTIYRNESRVLYLLQRCIYKTLGANEI